MRRGDWIQTASGGMFWPLNPQPEDVFIEDIAHALSMQCRFAGHVHTFHSVAHHSVLVSLIVPPEDALWGLLHDAAEAYMGDVPRPVKRYLPDYQDAEDCLLMVIGQTFGLSVPMPASVGVADRVLLATEARDLMGPPPMPWASIHGVEPLAEKIRSRSPMEAKELFLARFRELRSNDAES